MYNITQIEKDLSVDYYFNNYVNIAKFLKLCEECPVYNNNWSCPSFDFNPEDIWKSYKFIKIIAFKFDFSKEILNKKHTEEEIDDILNEFRQEKEGLTNIIYDLEKKHENSLALFFGNCEICDVCTRVKNQPCVHPEKMRYSIESLGGNVDDTIEDIFKYKILWPKDGKLPEYLFLVGGLLY